MEIENGDSKEVRCEMHSCLRFPMRLCRWCGVFPVEGLDGPDIRELRFNVRSFYSLYCLSAFLGYLWMMFLSAVNCFRKPFSLGTLTTVVYRVSGFVSSVNIYVLAKKWPELMKKSAEIESRLVEIRISKRTHVKCTSLFLLIMSMNIVEMSVHLIYAFHMARICLNQDELTNVSEFVFRTRLLIIYDIMGYNPWIAIYSEAVNLRMTWIWTLQDVLPVCFSVYLTSYLRDLNKVIYDRVYNDAISWNQLRAHYADVVTLLHEIDSRLCRSLLISYASGLFFVCVQLFNFLREELPGHRLHCYGESLAQAAVGPEHDAFYTFNLMVVTVRVFIITLFAANVNHEAAKPIAALHSAPASAYGLEIQRFRRQINYETIALGGVFFHVTRPLILKVIGTIVTYELVLLQVGSFSVGRGVTNRLDEFVNHNFTV